MSCGPHHEPRNDFTVQQVMRHQLRIGLLRLMGDRLNVTAIEAMEELSEKVTVRSLSRFNYHLWVLSQYGVVEATGNLTDCGLPYRVTNRGRLLLDAMKCEGGGA